MRFPVQVALITLASGSASLPSLRAAEPDPIDAEVKELRALHNFRVTPLKDREPGYEERYQNARRESFIELHRRGTDFVEKHPTDPRRWDVLVLLSVSPYYEEFQRFDGTKTIVPDYVRSAAWDEQYKSKLTELLTSTEASRGARETAIQALIYLHAMAAQGTPQAAEPEINRTLRLLAMLERDYHTSGSLLPAYTEVANMLERTDPQRCLTFLLAASDHHRGESLDDQRLGVFISKRIAASRRKAPNVADLWKDLGKVNKRLRDRTPYEGKPTLIALFPVTYGPTTDQLETIHRDYGSLGLQIIHVSGASFSPSAPASMQSRKGLEAYVSERHWPWAVIYDGDSILDKWNLHTIPSCILVGRNGQIIAQLPQPEQLRPFIKRDLGL